MFEWFFNIFERDNEWMSLKEQAPKRGDVVMLQDCHKEIKVVEVIMPHRTEFAGGQLFRMREIGKFNEEHVINSRDKWKWKPLYEEPNCG